MCLPLPPPVIPMSVSRASPGPLTTQPARFGDAEMERAIDRLGELLIGGDGEELVGRLHRHLELVKVVILEQLDMVERALDQSLGAGLAIFLEQVALQAAGIDADPH